MRLAQELVRTCVMTYTQTSTGLGPEEVRFSMMNSNVKSGVSATEQAPRLEDLLQLYEPDAEGGMEGEPLLNVLFHISKSFYILRPETLESVYVLYQTTKNPVYRDWGWRIFEAIQEHCLTPSSYTGIIDVDAPAASLSRNERLVRDENTGQKSDPNWNNSMQSFFLAETMKYLYLLFDDNGLVSLDEYVFNTEAHPMKIIKSANAYKEMLNAAGL
jgi:hypothetical protein